MPVTPGLQLPYGIQPVNAVPVDSYSGPFTGSADTVPSALTAANAGIPSALRFKSMEVRLIVSGSSKKYWYRDGVADANLIEFVSPPTGSNTQIQFNDNGVLGASSGLVFATGSNSLTISGDLAVDGGDITSSASSTTIFATGVSSVAIGGAASTISFGNSSNANGFTLNVAASRTGSIGINLATGATVSGLIKNINIGQGGDQGSTTNIRIGTTDTAGTSNIYMSGSLYITGSVGMKGSIVPDAHNTYTLGTDAIRWAHIYTGDLHLRNERGDWTVIEENDFLRIVNNKTGKNYKMLMQLIDE